LYDFENAKIAFVPNDALESQRICKWFLTKAYLRILPSLLITLLLKAYLEFWVGINIVKHTYLAYVVKSNLGHHQREVSYP
jgi:hypothetical protein